MLCKKREPQDNREREERKMGWYINLLHPEATDSPQEREMGLGKRRMGQSKKGGGVGWGVSFTVSEGEIEKKGQLVDCNTPKVMYLNFKCCESIICARI